jgi:hypothetical protein
MFAAPTNRRHPTPQLFRLPSELLHRSRAAPRAIGGSTDAKQGDIAMTSQTIQLRARYARMYAVGILTLLAVTVTGAAWTQGTQQSPTIDVSEIMSSINTDSLPVDDHRNAF